MKTLKYWLIKKELWKLAVLIAVISFVGYQTKSAEIAQAIAQTYKQEAVSKDTRLEAIIRENEALRIKLEASNKVNAPESIKELSRYYIRKYFGDNAPRVITVMQCESGLSNQTINTRTGDYGLYQLNARWHKARFEKMYGVKFEVGAMDFELASKYAKFLFDNSGLSAWVCSRIV